MRVRRAIAWVGASALVVLLGLAVGVWFERDLPRRKVESALARALNAEVDLGRLVIRGSREFVLHDLRIRKMAGRPRLESLSIGTLEVTGSITEITNARFESMRAADLEARVTGLSAQPAGGPATVPQGEPASQAIIGRLEIVRARIVLLAPAAPAGAQVPAPGPDGDRRAGTRQEAANGSTRESGAAAPVPETDGTDSVVLGGDAMLTGVGTALAGTIAIRPGQVRVEPLLRFVFGPASSNYPQGVMSDLQAAITIADKGREVRGTIGAGRLTLERSGRSIALADPTIAFEGRSIAAGGPMAIEIRPQMAALDAGLITAQVDLWKGTIDAFTARIRGLDLAALALAAGPLPAGWTLEGGMDADLDGSGSRMSYRIAAHPRAIVITSAGAPLRPADVAITADGTLVRGSQGELLGPVRAQVSIGSLSRDPGAGGWTIPQDLFPVGVELNGSIEIHDHMRWEGTAVIESRTAGRLEVSGDADTRPVQSQHSTLPTALPGATKNQDSPPPGAPPGASQSQDSPPLAAPPAWTVDLSWVWTGLDLARFESIARTLGAVLPANFQLAGKAQGRGTIKGGAAAPLVEGEVSLDPLSMTMGPANVPAGQSSRTGAAQAQSARPVSWELRAATARAAFSWRVGAGPIEIRALTAAGKGSVGSLEPVQVELTARGRCDPERGTAALDEAVLDAGGLFRATASGSGSLWREDARAAAPTASANEPAGSGSPAGADRRATGRVKLTGIELPRWQAFLRPMIGDPAPGYTVSGLADADLSGSWSWDGTWSASGSASVHKSGFSSEDGAHVVEGLETSWHLDLDGRTLEGPISLRADAMVGGFQVLWGSFFADGSALTSNLKLTAQLRPPPPEANQSRAADASPNAGSRASAQSAKATSPASRSTDGWLWSGRAIWTLPDGPRIEASVESPGGSVSGDTRGRTDSVREAAQEQAIEPRGDANEAAAPPPGNGTMSYTLAVQVDDLGSTVRKYLRGTLGSTVPFFEKVEAAGALHAEARGRLGGEERTLRGLLKIDGMRLTGIQGLVEVQGLDLELPLDLQWSAPDAHGIRALSGPEQFGSLGFSRLDVRGLEIPPTKTALLTRADAMQLKESLVVPLLGGALRLERLTLTDLLSEARHAEASIKVKGVSVESLTRAFNLTPLDGTIDAQFPKVWFSVEDLKVEGGGEARLFGGTVKIGEISGQDMLSAYPKLMLTAEFQEIDLGQLTRKLDFGEMTGIVSGYVRNCELFGGTPVAFDGEVATVERKGISRKVNVKAIKNLTILGTGSQVNIFDRGLQKFFKTYTYDRIGVHVSLKDDNMMLRGLEHRGDQELFVKGRLPFPINVVNAQPGATVSFLDMVERLRNLDLGAASVQK